MKATVYLFFFILLLFTSCQKGKNVAIKNVSNDSIAKFLEYANEDSIPLEKRLEFNNRAFEILKQRENDSLTRANLFKVANRYYNLNYLRDYKSTVFLLSEKSTKRGDTLSLGKSFLYIGDYYERVGISDSALFYYTKAKKIYSAIKSYSNLGATYINMGRVKSSANDYVGSEVLLTKALKIFRDSDDFQRLYETYNILGYISTEMRDYSNAVLSFNKALELVNSTNLNPSLHHKAILQNNIGHVYQVQELYEQAIIHYSKALEQDNLLRDTPELYATIIDNIGYSKLRSKDLKQLPDLFNESLRIRDSLNLQSSMVYSLTHLSEYYQYINDFENARKLSEQATSKARTGNNPVDLLVSLRQAVNVDPLNASKYSKEYMLIRDSLQHMERQQKDKFARIQFETDEIALQKDILEEQNRNLFSFFIATIMIILLLFVIRTQRAKNRELLLREAQQKANEEIYNLMLSQQHKMEEGRIKEKKKIAQELHDGVLGRLFGARLNLDSLNKTNGEEAEIKRRNYLTELKNIEQDIREISHDLSREKSALINNFVAIFTNLVEEQSSSYSAKVHSNISDSIKWDQISNNLKINIYRITQEALQNINKYANANTININLITYENSIELVIADDGIGFDTIKKSKGIGIQNITTRAEQCKGILKIKSAKGEGTSISITFPEKQLDGSESKAKSKNHKSDKKWLPQ